jgi:hypothetical protein
MNEQRIIANKDYGIQMKEEDTKNTRCVSRRIRDNDLSPGSDKYTLTRTKYIGLLNPENQQQTNQIQLNGMEEWPSSTTTKEVESFLGFENFDKEFTQNVEDLMKPQNKRNKNKQDNKDIVMLPEELFLNLLGHEFNDERTFENGDEQFDLIKTLSVHGLKTLHNCFSKIATATSVNDVIAVNVMNMDLQKWITMAQDMNMIINDTINILLGRRPNIWEDILEDWLIRILRLPNKNTALTNHNTLRYSKPIQKLNGKQAKRRLFLSGQPSHYTEESTDNQSIGEEDNQEILVQNVFNTPMKGILLPWNP